MIKISFLTLLVLTLTNVCADQYEEPFDPFKDRKISVIKYEDMDKVARTCNIKQDARFDYWPITNVFANLVDDQVKMHLKSIKYQPSFKRPVHKQFLGLQTDAGEKIVYVFVYPQPSRVIEKEYGNPVLLCRKSKDNLILEFDRNTAEFKRVTL